MITFYDKSFDYKVYSGGDIFYTSVYNKQEFFYDIEIHEYTKIIKEFIEKIIIAKDALQAYHYNPVGLPVNVEIFQ